MLSHGLRSSRVTKPSLKQIFQGKVEIDFSQQNSLKHHWCRPDVDCWLPSSLLIGPGHSWRSLVVCGHDTSLVCSHDVVFQWPSGVLPLRPRLVSNRDTCVSCWGLWVKVPDHKGTNARSLLCRRRSQNPRICQALVRVHEWLSLKIADGTHDRLALYAGLSWIWPWIVRCLCEKKRLHLKSARRGHLVNSRIDPLQEPS